jgi:pyridoxine 5'-phosphate synthase PdxJ
MLGRRHVKTRDIFELLDELRVAQNLEAADEARFETVCAPMPWSTPPDVPVRP